MRTLLTIAALVTSISAIAQSQVPNVFEDGTPASAAEVNENFEYVLENASGGGGCSATQQDNSVLLECADGTSGVIAGAGTVVVYPEGSLGTIPTTNLPQGEFVIFDGNDTLLGPRFGGWNGVYDIRVEITANNETLNKYVRLVNDEATSTVDIIEFGQGLSFAELDCQGAIFTSATDALLPNLRDEGWLVTTAVFSPALMKSNISWPDFVCENSELIMNAPALAIEYTPAPEILNAVYPVRLEQLP